MRAFLLAAFLALASLASAAPPALTWSPTDHSLQAGTSGATATRTGIPFGHTWDSARGDTSQTTGVRTITFHVDEIGPTGIAVGLANGAAPLTNYIGVDNNGVQYWSIGQTRKNGTWAGVQPPPFTTGDTIGMRVDLIAHTVAFNKGGSAWSSTIDITSLGSDVFPAVSLGSSATGQAASSITITADDWNDYPWTTLNIAAVGDSMTNNGGVLRTYVPRLVELIATNRVGWAQGYHFGINGATWQYAWSEAGYPYSINQDIPLRAIPALSTSIPNWVHLFAGSNGDAIFHDTAASQYMGLKTAIGLFRAAGVPADHIVVYTMLPRGNESFRGAYNSLIVSDPDGLGYRVARLDLDPTIGCASCNLTPAFLPDHIHPADSSQQIIAQIGFSVMTFP